MISLVVVVLVSAAHGGVILPSETVVHGAVRVGELDPYRSYDRKLGVGATNLYPLKSYSKYDQKLRPSYEIAVVDYDIKHQLADLERNLAAARPYLATNPQVLHEAEEQLKVLQHIHAGRLLHGIESIRQLELEQEVLIQKVNAQLENSVRQLKHLAVLQQEISDKQKPPVQSSPLPGGAADASKQLTAQLHAIEAAKAEEAMAQAIAQDAVEHAIAKEVVDHAIAKEAADHALATEVHRDMVHRAKFVLPGAAGVSVDEGDYRAEVARLDPRISSSSDQLDSEDHSKEDAESMVFNPPSHAKLTELQRN